MPRRSITSDNVGDVPGYIGAARLADWDWRDQALCREPHDGIPGLAWTVDSWQRIKMPTADDPHRVVKGERFIQLAKMICRACRVQWDCARFAVITQACSGTYSDDIKSILWLAKRPDWNEVLDRAQSADVPVQVAIRRRKAS